MIDAERLREMLLDQERARQSETAARRTSDALVRCVGALATAIDPTSVFDCLLPELIISLDADSAFVLVPDGDDPVQLRVEAVSHPGLAGAGWRRQGLLARLAVARPAASVFDVAQLPEWRADGSGIVSALVLYLGPVGRPALLVCGSAKRGHFQPAHLALARTLSPIAAQALIRAGEHRRLRTEIAERTSVEVELKRQQALTLHLHKMQALAQLSAGMAHEINTPLQYASDNLRFLTTSLPAVLGTIRTLAAWLEPNMEKGVLRQFLDMADIAYLTDEAPKAAEQCRIGLERVGAIVASLKRFAAVGPGEATAADLNDAIRTTLEVCSGDIDRVADVRLELGDLPLVTCWIGEIHQVLHAVLTNAMQAVEDRGRSGRGSIAVATRSAGGLVEIAIADDGVGMDQDVLRRACEPFFTTRPVGSGSGQGLAIAHEVVLRHGGELRLASTPGSGSTVTIILPQCAKGSRTPVV